MTPWENRGAFGALSEVPSEYAAKFATLVYLQSPHIPIIQISIPQLLKCSCEKSVLLGKRPVSRKLHLQIEILKI